MKIYYSNQEIQKDISFRTDNTPILQIKDDLVIACDINITALLNCWNLYSYDRPRNIRIKGGLYSAGHIYVKDIELDGELMSKNITARHIHTNSLIEAEDVIAQSIDAGDICYYALCMAYDKFSCRSIQGRIDNAKYFSINNKVSIRGY